MWHNFGYPNILCAIWCIRGIRCKGKHVYASPDKCWNVEGNVGQKGAENQIVAGKYLEKQLTGLTLLMSLSGVPVKKMDSHLKELITHGRDISFDRFMIHGCNHVGTSSEKGPSKTHGTFHIHGRQTGPPIKHARMTKYHCPALRNKQEAATVALWEWMFYIRSYCWWFRNPKANHRLDGAKTL